MAPKLYRTPSVENGFQIQRSSLEGERPLTHKTRKDSRTIPGAVMADIWMRVRRELAKDGEADRSEPATLDE
jgi:hypothetical protein